MLELKDTGTAPDWLPVWMAPPTLAHKEILAPWSK
jgi:hypothetical protein